LKGQKEDSNKVNTLNSLSLTYWQDNDHENAMLYAKAALSLSEKIHFRKGEANATVFIGMASGLKREPEELTHYLNALNIYREIGDLEGLNDCYTGIIAMYIWQGNYAEASKYAYIKLKISENSKDRKKIAEALGWLGHVNSLQGNKEEALINFRASLKLNEEMNDQERIAEAYLAIGGTYYEKGELENALQKYYSALKILTDTKNPNLAWRMPFVRMNIGLVYEKQGDLFLSAGDKPSALRKYQVALDSYLAQQEVYATLKDKGSIAQRYLQLGNIYMKLNEPGVAREHLNKALGLFQFSRSKGGLKETYASLSSLDSMERNYKEAYIHFRHHISYRDSLVNEESTKKSLMYKMQYETEKKEAAEQADRLKKAAGEQRKQYLQNILIGLLGILLFGTLAIALIQWRNNKHKQKANLMLRQQKEKIESTLTELKFTQSQLIQSEKMASLGELTAGIAHEIQNPLNFVNNFSEVNAELLQEMRDEISNGKIDDALALANNAIDNQKKINHHGKRADAIVKGMLQHSRNSNGVKEPTDINALADEYLRLAYHGLRAKDKSFNASMKTDFDQTIGKINLIPQDVGRVILNLITNAFYAVSDKNKSIYEDLTIGETSPEKLYEPLVTVTTKKLNSKVQIAVRDNGNGIPSNVIDKIFQPFFTTKPTGKGTGLGLSMSYDIITKGHDGELRVNTKEGQYAEFIIILPT
jgi:signal transduction histidine kinase